MNTNPTIAALELVRDRTGAAYVAAAAKYDESSAADVVADRAAYVAAYVANVGAARAVAIAMAAAK